MLCVVGLYYAERNARMPAFIFQPMATRSLAEL